MGDVEVTLNALIWKAQQEKPNDRSEVDRNYAILITELQKVKAWYLVYCATKE